MNLKFLAAGMALASTVALADGPQFSVFPGLQYGSSPSGSVSGMSFNILGAENRNVSGFDLSLLGYRQVNNNFNGFHLALFGLEAFRVSGDMSGVSFSLWNDIQRDMNGGTFGLVNTVGGDAVFEFGFVNTAHGKATAQFGFVNYAQSVGGIQFGFVNATQNLEGVQIGLVNYAKNGILPVLPILNFKKSF